jgi:hypothetical protein
MDSHDAFHGKSFSFYRLRRHRAIGHYIIPRNRLSAAKMGICHASTVLFVTTKRFSPQADST